MSQYFPNTTLFTTGDAVGPIGPIGAVPGPLIGAGPRCRICFVQADPANVNPLFLGFSNLQAGGNHGIQLIPTQPPLVFYRQDASKIYGVCPLGGSNVRMIFFG